ncbi:MAG: hypothetical protein ACR2J6_04705 [Thermoleophilaceae bacterium]
MREQPKGAMARATAMAEGVATAMRRRQRDREPRVLLYRRPGDPRVLAPGAKGQDRVLGVAEKMVALVDEADPQSRSKRRARRQGAGQEDEDA